MHYRLHVDLVEVHPPDQVEVPKMGDTELSYLLGRPEKLVPLMQMHVDSDDVVVLAGFLQAAADATSKREG